MRILLIHRYFWPDTPPYAVILKKIASRLASDGHDVEVLSTQPGYLSGITISKQKNIDALDGYKIRRVSLLPDMGGKSILKAMNMFLFAFKILLHSLFHRRYDVIMISTSPPVLAGLSARIASKVLKSKFLYHYMDIHPEIGQLSGDFNNKLIFNLLKKIDLRSTQSADRIIVLSNDMKDSLLKRGVLNPNKIRVIQNFNLNEKQSISIDISNLIHGKSSKVRLIFAGNIGRFQALDSFLDNFLSLNNTDNIELIFLGSGKMSKILKNKVKNASSDNVYFIPYQPLNIANEIIKTADFGIVSLGEKMYQYAYPTKVIAYLSQACPILAYLETKSNFSSFILENNIGVCIDPYKPNDFSDKIRWIKSHPNEVNNMKTNCKLSFQTLYNESTVLDKWSHLYKELVKN